MNPKIQTPLIKLFQLKTKTIKATFYFNKKDVRLKTVSLWSYVNSFKNEFKNSAYVEYDGIVGCSTSLASLQLWTAYYFQYKEIIDDSLNETTVNSALNVNPTPNLNSQEITYEMTNPLLTVNAHIYCVTFLKYTTILLITIFQKPFGQAFFQQVVSQMKASVRTYSSQEPELVKYRASLQPTDISN